MKYKIYFFDFKFLDKLIHKIFVYLTKEHTRIVRNIAVFEAQNLARKNLPNNSEVSMESYLSSLRGAYNGLKQEVSVQLQADVQKIMGTVNIATANQKILAKENSIKNEEDKINNLLVDKGRIHLRADINSYKKYQWLLFLFGLGECIWNLGFFIKIGDILVVAVSIGFLLGIAQIMAVKFSVQAIKEVENKKIKQIYALITIIFFLVLSIFLSTIRYWFFHEGQGAKIPFLIVNPFVFAMINLLFVFVTGIVVYLFYPTISEIKQIRKLIAIDNEIEKIKQKIEKLESELNYLKDEREFLVEVRKKMIGAQDNFMERIDAFYEEAVGAFKHENIVKRTDGFFPTCFKNTFVRLSELETKNSLLIE